MFLHFEYEYVRNICFLIQQVHSKNRQFRFHKLTRIVVREYQRFFLIKTNLTLLNLFILVIMTLILCIEIQMRDEASFVRVLKKKQNLVTTLNIDLF